MLIDEVLGNKTTSDVLMALWFTFNRTAALKMYVPGMLPTHFEHPALAPSRSGAWNLPGGSWGKEWATKDRGTSEPAIAWSIITPGAA